MNNETETASIPYRSEEKHEKMGGLIGLIIYRTRFRAHWEKLSLKTQKWIMRGVGLLFALGYIGILKLFHVWIRPDHAFVAFLIFALFFGDARNFIIYWGPFVLLWLTYDMLRGIAWLVMPYIYVEELYYTELWLTGWMLHGNIFPFALQTMKKSIEGTVGIKILNWIGAFYYINHMTAPILLAWLLYWKQDDKTEFKRLVYTLILTSWTAFITFLLFPSAPPWYVWNNGNGLNFEQPDRNIKPSAGGLVDLDRLTGFSFFQSFYQTFNANPFAAFPSLHAAYSLITFFFAYRKWKKWSIPLVIWPIGMWFFAMYLNHHYLIDLIWGAFYATCFFLMSLKVFKPKKKMVDEKDIETEQSEEAKKISEKSEYVSESKTNENSNIVITLTENTENPSFEKNNDASKPKSPTENSND